MLLTGDLGAISTFGSTGHEMVQAVVSDHSGNTYLTGTFTGTVDFDPGRKVNALVSRGGSDVFVAKFSSGNELLWVRQLGGAGDDIAGGVAVDSGGNVYTTGGFVGTVDFDPRLRGFNQSSAGGVDAFVWNLDSQGQVLWESRAGGRAFDAGTSVAVASSGQVVVGGVFTGRATFQSGHSTLNLSGPGSRDAFIWRLSSSGRNVMVEQIGGPGADYVHAVAMDSSGSIYAAGEFSGLADFNPAARIRNLPNSGGRDAFVVKLNARGQLLWARSVGGASSDSATGLALDGQGNAYVSGYFAGTADFDPGAAASTMTSAGGSDAFLWELDRNGSLVIAKQVGGRGNDLAQGVTLDSAGNIYLAGSFQRTPDFDPGAGVTNITSQGRTDAFVVKLANSGRFVYARTFGGSSQDQGTGVAVMPDGKVSVVGAFSGTAAFAPGGSGPVRSATGGMDGFNAVLTQSDPEFGLAKQPAPSGSATVTAVAVTDQDDVFLAGTFSGTVNFGTADSPYTLTARGYSDMFVARYCNKLNMNWIKQLGGDGADGAYDVVVDDARNVYFVGSFQRTVDMDPGSAQYNLDSAGGADAFVASLDYDGNFRWAQSMGGAGDDVAYGLGGNGAGQLAVAGSFAGAADFNPGGSGGQVTSAGGTDIFLAQFHTSGNSAIFDRVAAMGGAGDDAAYAAAVDRVGNAYLTGSFSRAADFDPGAGQMVLNGPAENNIFAAKLTSGGALAYAQHLGGTDGGLGHSIAVDEAGDAYLTGWFAGTGDFDPTRHHLMLTSAGGRDGFLVKLNPTGGLGWAKAFGGSGDDEGYSVALDPAGAAYVTGGYRDTANFNSGGSGGTLTSAGDSDIFIAKFGGAGQFAWVRSMGGDGFDYGFDTAVGGSGSFVYLIGQFTGTADMDPGAGQSLLSSSGFSSFAMRLIA